MQICTEIAGPDVAHNDLCVCVCVFVCLCVFSIRACLVACNYEPVHNEDIYIYIYTYQCLHAQ
jgi:hypothetical protein